MANNKIDLKMLSKRVELIELEVKELEKINPEKIQQRLAKIEEKLYVSKEMLTSKEVADYLDISLSQLYKFTCSLVIPHYKSRGKMVYFDRKEIIKWMRKNHVKACKPKPVTDPDRNSASTDGSDTDLNNEEDYGEKE